MTRFHDRHDFPEVVVSGNQGDHDSPEVVPIMKGGGQR